MKALNNRRDMIRFTIPVALENLLTLTIGMVVSALIGRLSSSALVAVGMANNIVTLVTGIFSITTVGSAVLLARCVGAGEQVEASHVAEQSVQMTLLIGLGVSAVFLAAAVPCMRLLMPTAEAQMFSEAVVYFRLMMISFPALMLNNVGASLLRASGNSRGPLLATALLNVVQVGAAAILILPLKMDIMGAGLSYVIARLVGAAIIWCMLLRSHSRFTIHPRNLLKPDFSIWRRTVRIGLPVSLDSIVVQLGYLLANSLIVGLGTHSASVYQVVNTLYTFAAYPQGVASAVIVSFMGRQLGASREDQARRTMWLVYTIAMGASLVLNLFIALNTGWLAAIYSTDPAVVRECRRVVWVMFVMCIPAISINAIDPGLRAGGDSRFAMIESTLGVWCVRLPLTWLMCYRLNMGAAGVFAANTVSLFVRMTLGLIRFHGRRWIHADV